MNRKSLTVAEIKSVDNQSLTITKKPNSDAVIIADTQGNFITLSGSVVLDEIVKFAEYHNRLRQDFEAAKLNEMLRRIFE